MSVFDWGNLNRGVIWNCYTTSLRPWHVFLVNARLRNVFMSGSPGVEQKLNDMVEPKKKYCLFPISDRPYQNMCDPNLFYGFPKKKKKKKFFFFFFFF